MALNQFLSPVLLHSIYIHSAAQHQCSIWHNSSLNETNLPFVLNHPNQKVIFFFLQNNCVESTYEYKMLFTDNAVVNRHFRQQQKLLKKQQKQQEEQQQPRPPSLQPNGNKNDLLTDDAKFKMLKKVHLFVIIFLKSSTIHGFTYLAQRGFHIIER